MLFFVALLIIFYYFNLLSTPKIGKNTNDAQKVAKVLYIFVAHEKKRTNVYKFGWKIQEKSKNKYKFKTLKSLVSMKNAGGIKI